MTLGVGTGAGTSRRAVALDVLCQDPGFGGGTAAQTNAFVAAVQELGREVNLHYVPHPSFGGRRVSLYRIDALRQLAGGRRLAGRLVNGSTWVVAATAPPGYGATAAGRDYSCWLGTSLADEWRGRVGLPRSRRVAQSVNAAPLRWLERRVLSSASRLYATSPWSRDRVADAAGRDDVGILPLPVDTSSFAPEPDDAWLARPPVVAFVGRAGDPRKNVRLLLDAARAVPDLGVRLIGEPPAGPIPPQVETLGRVASVAEHLRTARLLVVPSYQEGFGLLAAEALACGVPVVTTPCGGPEDLVRRSGAGKVLSGFEPEELADTLRALAEDAGTLLAMRRRGREHVVREHSPSRLRDLLADVLD